MGRRNSSGKKKQSQRRKKSTKRKEISPQIGNFEKKIKCAQLSNNSTSDKCDISSESIATSEETGISYVKNNRFSVLSAGNMSYLENQAPYQSQVCDNSQSIISGSNTVVNPAVMNPSQLMLQNQHIIAGMSTPLAMSSPNPSLFQPTQVQQSVISDNDILRISDVLKNVLKQEIESMVSLQLEAKLTPFKQEISQLRDENEELRKDLNDVKMKQDRAEQYGRKCNARIANYRFSKTENTNDLVCSIASTVGVTIDPREIDVSHRTGKAKLDRPREIIVKFASVAAKSKFMKCRKLLRVKKSDIFISEDLTDFRSNLLFNCRQLKKDNNSDVEKAWTFNGNVFIEVKGVEEPLKVQTCDDLALYMPKAD